MSNNVLSTDTIYDEIRRERDNQDEKWGIQEHDPTVWITILGEEFGEAASGVLKQKTTDRESYRDELVQVAAVAVAAAEAFDRQNPRPHPRIECSCLMYQRLGKCWHTGYQPDRQVEVGHG